MENKNMRRMFRVVCAANIVLLVLIAYVAYTVMADEGPMHEANVSISNNTGEQVAAEIYVLNSGGWDYNMYVLNADQQVNFNVKWTGDRDKIIVFCVYSYLNETRSFRYSIDDHENFMDMLI